MERQVIQGPTFSNENSQRIEQLKGLRISRGGSELPIFLSIKEVLHLLPYELSKTLRS